MFAWLCSRRTLPFQSARFFSVACRMDGPLRIGYVPEHFSTPLHFAKQRFGLDASLVPYPSGTGHMIQSLQAAELDVAIGLTEGWVAGIGKHREKAGYKIVGTYVETPLCWAISTGFGREDLTSVDPLRNKKVGVSRIGSGSYVMSFVLADQQGWLEKPGQLPFEVVPLDTFAKLRQGVNDGTADFFMWEHFTTKRYWDNKKIKRIGEIYTPWSSWKIVARDPTDGRLNSMSESINKGIQYFNENHEEAVKYIISELDYTTEDAKEWLKTVKFTEDVWGTDPKVIDKAIRILGEAGVLDPSQVSSGDMIAVTREA